MEFVLEAKSTGLGTTLAHDGNLLADTPRVLRVK
jgi:hypothetical protein